MTTRAFRDLLDRFLGTQLEEGASPRTEHETCRRKLKRDRRVLRDGGTRPCSIKQTGFPANYLSSLVVLLCALRSLPWASGQDPDCNRNGIPDGLDITVREYGLVQQAEYLLGEGEGSPVGVLAEDFDGDGDVDLVGADGSGRIDVRVNHDDGSFGLGGVYYGSDSADLNHIAAADTDGDDDMDLVLFAAGFHGWDPSIAILRNSGDGRFEESQRTQLEAWPYDGAAADLDGDGRVDLVASVDALQGLETRVYGQLVDGTFALRDVYPFVGNLLANDLDGDGDIDLLVGKAVLINRADGSFDQHPEALEREWSTKTTGDFDGDGDLDIAALDRFRQRTSLQVLENMGGGLFRTSTSTEALEHVRGLTSGDFDRDGDLDLVLVKGEAGSSGTFSLFLNEGKGSFGPPLSYSTGTRLPGGIVVPTDLNGDGWMDLALGVYETRSIATFLNRPLATSPDCDQSGVPDECEFEFVDCNGNGTADVCDIARGTARDCDQNGVPDECDLRSTVAFSDPGLIQEIDFEPPFFNPAWIALGDVDGDGDDDLVVANTSLVFVDIVVEGSTVTLFLNTGDGLSFERREFEIGEPSSGIVLNDLDGDGDLDLAVAFSHTFRERGVSVFSNRGDGRFLASTRLESMGERVAAGDINGDGSPDLFTPTSVHINRGDGTFELAEDLTPDGLSPFLQARLRPEEAAADLDADGDPDLARLAGDPVRVEVLLNQGNGVLLESIELTAGARPRAIAAADIDRDGDPDLAVSNFGTGDLSIFLNRGDATFAPPVQVPASGSDSGLPDPRFVVSGDLDGDGMLDLITGDPRGSALNIVLNRTMPAASADDDGDGIPDACVPRSFHRADTNDDGQLDVTDIVYLLRFLFSGGPAPTCLETGDANNDGSLDITDGIALLGFLFLGSDAPALPGPPSEPCGPDTDAPGSRGDLGCNLYSSC